MMIKATVIGPEPFAYRGRYRPKAAIRITKLDAPDSACQGSVIVIKEMKIVDLDQSHQPPEMASGYSDIAHWGRLRSLTNPVT